jgi:hypothetical protein
MVFLGGRVPAAFLRAELLQLFQMCADCAFSIYLADCRQNETMFHYSVALIEIERLLRATIIAQIRAWK